MFIEVTQYDINSEVESGRILININSITKLFAYDFRGVSIIYLTDGNSITVKEKYSDLREILIKYGKLSTTDFRKLYSTNSREFCLPRI